MGRRSKKVFRDGKVHVCAEMCATCVFRPGNLMRLAPGRLKSMVAAAQKHDSCIPCHETTFGQDPRGQAICRGFFDNFATAPLRIAERLGFVQMQSPGDNSGHGKEKRRTAGG